VRAGLLPHLLWVDRPTTRCPEWFSPETRENSLPISLSRLHGCNRSLSSLSLYRLPYVDSSSAGRLDLLCSRVLGPRERNEGMIIVDMHRFGRDVEKTSVGTDTLRNRLIWLLLMAIPVKIIPARFQHELGYPGPVRSRRSKFFGKV
jgi:hypothetical protein